MDIYLATEIIQCTTTVTRSLDRQSCLSSPRTKSESSRNSKKLSPYFKVSHIPPHPWYLSPLNYFLVSKGLSHIVHTYFPFTEWISFWCFANLFLSFVLNIHNSHLNSVIWKFILLTSFDLDVVTVLVRLY